MIKDIEHILKIQEKENYITVPTEKIIGHLESVIIENLNKEQSISGRVRISNRDIIILDMKRAREGIFPIRLQPMFPDAEGLFTFNADKIALNDILIIEYFAPQNQNIKITIRYDG